MKKLSEDVMQNFFWFVPFLWDFCGNKVKVEETRGPMRVQNGDK
jgi:hypothetical protein